MIKRNNPDLDNYLPGETFDQLLSFSHLVTANGILFIGGVAPVRGAEMEIVTPGDLRGQCEFVLDVLRSSLEAGSSSTEHLLDWTIYLNDSDGVGAIGKQYLEIAPLLKTFVGSQGPSCTAVGVPGLFIPEQLIEIQAIAAVK